MSLLIKIAGLKRSRKSDLIIDVCMPKRTKFVLSKRAKFALPRQARPVPAKQAKLGPSKQENTSEKQAQYWEWQYRKAVCTQAEINCLPEGEFDQITQANTFANTKEPQWVVLVSSNPTPANKRLTLPDSPLPEFILLSLATAPLVDKGKKKASHQWQRLV